MCDALSGRPLRGQTYRCVSALNRRHMVWAWFSLFSVGFADLYVRMCSMGILGVRSAHKRPLASWKVSANCV